MLPESKLYIPQTRNIPALELSEERCKYVPRNQEWGCAWVDRVPDQPGGKYERFVIVPLRVFKTGRMAQKFLRQITKTPEYKDRPLMIFQMGYWLVLPSPEWLKSDNDRVEYNSATLIKLIERDTKSTVIKQEVMKRRQKEKAAKLAEADRKYVKPTYAKSTKSIDQKELQAVVPARHAQYRSADEETALLEAKGRRYERPDPEDEKKEQTWKIPTDLMSDELVWGLMWVLPDVQSPGQKFEAVSFAWLGAYQTHEHLEQAQRAIKKEHPEWSVISFRVGQPLQLPIPSWLMQVDSKYVYDQDTVCELMMQSPNYRTPEEVDAEIESRKIAAKHTAIDADGIDLLDRIAPCPETTDDEKDTLEDQCLLKKDKYASENGTFGMTMTQYTKLDLNTSK